MILNFLFIYVSFSTCKLFCLHLKEIKCVEDEVPKEANIEDYHKYWNAKPGGHAGVALFSKVI